MSSAPTEPSYYSPTYELPRYAQPSSPRFDEKQPWRAPGVGAGRLSWEPLAGRTVPYPWELERPVEAWERTDRTVTEGRLPARPQPAAPLPPVTVGEHQVGGLESGSSAGRNDGRPASGGNASQQARAGNRSADAAPPPVTVGRAGEATGPAPVPNSMTEQILSSWEQRGNRPAPPAGQNRPPANRGAQNRSGQGRERQRRAGQGRAPQNQGAPSHLRGPRPLDPGAGRDAGLSILSQPQQFPPPTGQPIRPRQDAQLPQRGKKQGGLPWLSLMLILAVLIEPAGIMFPILAGMVLLATAKNYRNPAARVGWAIFVFVLAVVALIGRVMFSG